MTSLLEKPSAYAPTFNGGDALFVLAHPDDEFLTGHAIDLANVQGADVHVLYASDGEASERLTPEQRQQYHRRYEVGRALGKYGVAGENQHFLGLPDGNVSDDTHTFAAALSIGRLLNEYPIRTVVTLGHFGYDNHQDHIAAHNAAEIAVKAFAVANPNIRLLGLTRDDTPLQIPGSPKRKLQNFSPHKSQVGIDLTDPNYRPVPGTVEQPGVRLTQQTRKNLAGYAMILEMERYKEYAVQ